MSVHLNPDTCLACSGCVVHCPVAEATPAFLGPRMIGPAFERFRLLGIVEDASLHYCANCKNCEISCPQNVPVATINMLARLEQCRKTPPSLRDWIVAHGELLARTTKYVPASLRNWALGLSLTRLILDGIGIAKQCPMPSFAKEPFRDHIQRIDQAQGKVVAFFPGCYTNYYDPQTGFDLVWVLNQAGYRVLVPKDFVCCGIPLISGGFKDDALANATQNAKVVAELTKASIPVITTCPSCRLMLTRELAAFFPTVTKTYGNPNVIDAMDFLARLIASSELALSPNPPTLSALYHAPCHLRAQGEGLPGFDLLRYFPSLSITNLNAGCCGISGSYGFKKEKYAIGQTIGSALFHAVKSSPVSVVASECGTCRLQIAGATGKTCLHPITLVRTLLEGNGVA
ncbi:MAG: anaerobic glycerol-3-phosphate dehydrogenase subunit C [Desulfovibrio sp.]|nr:anaerobic glycerol-3-phosphate dehydrogenase subunit C [Desulfovibrio sp.]